MKTLRNNLIRLTGWLLIAIGMLPVQAMAADCNCGSDIAVPPFLGEAVVPNALLVIDNSASMLDLAYVNNAATCYDDTYSDAGTYAGYFNPQAWFAYSFGDKKFSEVTAAAAGAFCSAAATQYKSLYLCVAGTMSSDEMTAVSGFYAKGNLLNWAAASKLDIQKEILTGGKYDNQQLKQESRGCGDRRFVKKIRVQYGAATHYVTLAVRPPVALTFPSWKNGVAYIAGDIVSANGLGLYKATTSGTSSGSGPLDDIGVSWAEYWGTRWHNGVFYAAGTLVTDPSKENTVDKGRIYIALNSGTASGTGVDNDTGVAWEAYDLTHIDIFKGSATGFDNTYCQLAVAELNSPAPSQGQLKNYIDGCMGTSNAGGSSGSRDANNAFNHAIHNCWYYVKHGGQWIPGVGTSVSTQNACEAIYAGGIQPWELNPDDRAYVCYGLYNNDATRPIGYVGRCWNPGTGCIKVCQNPNKVYPAECPTKWKYDCTNALPAGWVAAGYASVEECIQTAMRDFCGSMEVPEVIDPSDQVGSATGETNVTWGLPAILTDSGVVAQLDKPVATMRGFIAKSDSPTGLIQEYADQIRLGAMAFNRSGSKTECSLSDPFVLYECTDPGNKDGGRVIREIADGSTLSLDPILGINTTHTQKLVSAINKIKANSWTPLAESFYNAIGYYKQDSTLRLNTDDFTVGTDPVQYWCQNNNILIMSEGASTADRNTRIPTLLGRNDVDCGTLDASTLLDDLAEYAHTLVDLGQIDGKSKQRINTHVVQLGTPRSGSGECDPSTLLTLTAQKGGTTLQTAVDAPAMEQALRNAFSAMQAGAAAGSAASVISATRSGEGAVYQAIFWPTIPGPTYDGVKKPDVKWAGEVHALLVDSEGRLYEDTGGDKALTPDDRRVIFFFDENRDKPETMACYGSVENGVCTGELKSLHEVRYLWSAAEWLAGISEADIVRNRTTYLSSEKKRWIFTWNDLDNDGVVDKTLGSSEILAFEDFTDWRGLAVNGDRRKVPFDFGINVDDATTNGKVNTLVNWVRGRDSLGLRSREAVKPPVFNVPGTVHDTATTITWRLGDVIYSTPTVVGRPAESFHLLYQDMSYIKFLAKYRTRRQVVYFGGNDGMLHAVNGGYYNAGLDSYCLTPDCSGDTGNAPLLGAELWAYVPYNLLPQLKCLADPGYNHRYFVDLKPRIFDAQIFPVDQDHPEGWGTILVQGMRLGGNTVPAGGSGLSAADTRKFISSYIILDVTNPEKPPVLLGELTLDPALPLQLGYTTAVPTIVPMKTGPATKWYLVLGSGPIWLDSSGNWVSNMALSGRSNKPGKIAVFPLDELTKSSPAPFRIPDQNPSGGNDKGRWVLPDNGFVSDLITADFDLEPNYRGDAVYFGTVEGDFGNWSGKMYRIVTAASSSDTAPYQWSTPQLLLNPGRPITAAASVGFDGYSYWVYFGTGRFFDKRDKSDGSSMAQDYYFGLKEPVSCGPPDSLNWGPVVVSELVRTDQIQVHQSPTADDAQLSCAGGASCLPSGVDSLSKLIKYIAGQGCVEGQPTGTSGWYQHLPLYGERNLGQATLLGGLLTFTTYQPFDDLCSPNGMSYLTAVYYQTGTAWHQAVFNEAYGTTQTEPVVVNSRLELGEGLASTPNLHVGSEDGAKAFVQTSTGAIVEIEQPNLPLNNVKSGRINWRAD